MRLLVVLLFATLAQTSPGDLTLLRHDLHRHPEISGQEMRTARVVAERMRAAGLEVRTGIGGHGVVAILRGGRPGPLVAYRADMDAVPSNDPDPSAIKSEAPGVRHICGHDLHVTVGVGVAEALARWRGAIAGSVMFIFQPSEERVSRTEAEDVARHRASLVVQHWLEHRPRAHADSTAERARGRPPAPDVDALTMSR